MDHPSSQNFQDLAAALAEEFRRVESPEARQHLLRDMVDRLGLCGVSFSGPAHTLQGMHFICQGPLDLHLPDWVDGVMATEISRTLWKVLRFILAGYNGLSAPAKAAAIDVLRPQGRERYASQYMALGYMRWLLDHAGIGAFDYYGNEVKDTAELFYGQLFERPEDMPEEYAASAMEIEREGAK